MMDFSGNGVSRKYLKPLMRYPTLEIQLSARAMMPALEELDGDEVGPVLRAGGGGG